MNDKENKPKATAVQADRLDSSRTKLNALDKKPTII